MRPLIYRRLGAAGGSENPLRTLPAGTMNLFPRRESGVLELNHPRPLSLGSTEVAGVKEPKTAQLTIFYAGKVVVFDDFPPQKVKDVVMMASRASFVGAVGPTPADVPPPLKKSAPRPTETAACDLPIARRASLHRFLEKRKDRLTARAPYKKVGDASGWVEEGSRLRPSAVALCGPSNKHEIILL
ncbi:hypothetical protein MLD38_014243 [Melastoma candidum]|uniref:Uncharacterized protein n=1 Tax=Melastoma candidum TaxID=119954 RepID=A0ACB9RDG8_9MYRT|nr:hypothetical protein MLD38_014243 [Melastoma candidum]